MIHSIAAACFLATLAGPAVAAPGGADACPALAADRAELHVVARVNGYSVDDIDDADTLERFVADPFVRRSATPQMLSALRSAKHVVSMAGDAHGRLAIMFTSDQCGALDQSIYLTAPGDDPRFLKPFLDGAR